MTLQLLRDRIQVLPDAIRDDITSSGIIVRSSKGIVQSQEQFGRKGTIVALGEEIDRDQLRVGDKILWGEFEFPEYVQDGTRYLIMRDQDVCAVLESES